MKLDLLLDAMRRFDTGGAAIVDWSIYASRSRRFALGVKDRETGNAHAPLTMSESLGARYVFVWNDGRVSRGGLERRQLEHGLQQTLAAARSAAIDDPDAAAVLGPDTFPEVPLHDPLAAAFARGDSRRLEDRLGRTRELISRRGLETWSASFSAAETDAHLQTSAGLDVTGSGTSTGWFVTVNGEIGGGHSARCFEGDDEFDARLEGIADLADELGREVDGAPGGLVPVILHPKVVESYVMSTLLHHLDGATVAHGEGLFPIAEFGSGNPVLREDLGLSLDPLEPLRSGSYRFTAEGVPAAKCVFLENGRLLQPVLDLKYSRRLKRPATPLPYSMDTVHLTGPEQLDLEAGYRRAEGGIVVLSVLGVHTQDSASGDFSLSAPQVLGLRGGKPAGRLRGTISGNLFDMLRNADLVRVRFPGEHTPGLLFPCRFDAS